MIERYRPKRDNPDVGYKRPPVHTRWPPGTSGNLKGRPKGTRNLQTDLLAELAERVSITEGGRKRKISKQRAFLKSLVMKAVKGEVRAAETLVKLRERHQSGDGQGIVQPLPEDDRMIIEQFLARYASKPGGSAGREPEEDPDGA